MVVQGGLSFISQVLQCSAEYPRNNSLWVFGQEIGVDTLLFPHALSILQENEHSETVSHLCYNGAAQHPIEHNTLLPKAKFLWRVQH